MTSGAGVGDQKVSADYASIMLELLAVLAVLQRIEDRLATLDPLLPHVPAAVAMLDNPAARWKLGRKRVPDGR